MSSQSVGSSSVSIQAVCHNEPSKKARNRKRCFASAKMDPKSSTLCPTLQPDLVAEGREQ
eukprot:9127016-Karenia_brevis.AAC.1